MPIDMEEVVKELCPKTLERKKCEGKQERNREIAINMLRDGAKPLPSSPAN